MSDLLMSFLVEGATSGAYGYRVEADGKVSQWRTSKSVKDASGAYHEEQVKPGFYPSVSLSERAVYTLREALQGSGIYGMPAEIHTASTSTDPRMATWTVGTPSGEKTVVITPWPSADPRVQALFQVTQTLNQLITAAYA
jgi:hypothetical protein